MNKKTIVVVVISILLGNVLADFILNPVRNADSYLAMLRLEKEQQTIDKLKEEIRQKKLDWVKEDIVELCPYYDLTRWWTDGIQEAVSLPCFENEYDYLQGYRDGQRWLLHVQESENNSIEADNDIVINTDRLDKHEAAIKRLDLVLTNNTKILIQAVNQLAGKELIMVLDND